MRRSVHRSSRLMSGRRLKIGLWIFVAMTILLGWRWFVARGEIISAHFIELQIANLEREVSDQVQIRNMEKVGWVQRAIDDGPHLIAYQMAFLVGYYEYHKKELAHSQLEWIVRRDYQRAMTNAVALLRQQTTNDLGQDPQAWIRAYAGIDPKN